MLWGQLERIGGSGREVRLMVEAAGRLAGEAKEKAKKREKGEKKIRGRRGPRGKGREGWLERGTVGAGFLERKLRRG